MMLQLLNNYKNWNEIMFDFPPTLCLLRKGFSFSSRAIVDSWNDSGNIIPSHIRQMSRRAAEMQASSSYG